MDNIRKRFENESKTRINIIGPTKSGKSTLILNLIKDGILENIDLQNETSNVRTIFSTEVLCSPPRSNEVKIYLSIKEKEKTLKDLKDYILNFIDEAFIKVISEVSNETVNCHNIKKDKLFEALKNEMKDNLEVPLNRFFNKSDLSQVFLGVNFDMLFEELKKENKEELLEQRDDLIWNKYFNYFSINYRQQYDEWMKKISECYRHTNEGYEYVNEEDYTSEKFINGDLKSIRKILYGIKSSCGLIIDRAYIEAPSKNNEYSGIVFIDYVNESLDKNIVKDVEKRVGEDYKELFMVVTKINEDSNFILNLKKDINKITLDKRIFCILNKFDSYGDTLFENSEISNIDRIQAIKYKTSKDLRINEERIIITEQFRDIDNSTLKLLPSNNEFLRLLKLIKAQSNSFSKTIKIKNPSKKNVINISLNAERMSVQTLMIMLYDRYNGHLVSSWSDIINNKDDSRSKKYYYNAIRTIIRNRKNDYKGYKHTFSNSYLHSTKTIDFSLRSGEHNDAKKILKMLVNYGYHTIGFNPDENKILITVNGEISHEDKENLVNSIKGRLEESVISYFEDSFLINTTNKRFTVNNLNNALESEKNITINDFYNAFKDIFNTMSENIQRYEVSIQ